LSDSKKTEHSKLFKKKNARNEKPKREKSKRESDENKWKGNAKIKKDLSSND
jgi:hypothetical protein